MFSLSSDWQMAIREAVDDSFRRVIVQMIKEWSQPKKGGFFILGIVEGQHFRVLYSESVGELEEDDHDTALAAATALAKTGSAISSWSIRDSERGIYGGAIRIGLPGSAVGEGGKTIPAIISFNGINEHADEAICVLTAHSMDWDVSERVTMTTSNNRLLADIVANLRRRNEW